VQHQKLRQHHADVIVELAVSAWVAVGQEGCCKKLRATYLLALVIDLPLEFCVVAGECLREQLGPVLIEASALAHHVLKTTKALEDALIGVVEESQCQIGDPAVDNGPPHDWGKSSPH